MHKVIISIISILLVFFYSSIFIVKEGERSIMLRFGRVLRDIENRVIIYYPGIHLKYPLIESVKKIDSRIKIINNQSDHFMNKEKKDLIVDSYIAWRINDFSRYYLSTIGGDVSQIEMLLKRIFSDCLRSEFSRLNLKDIVNDSHGYLTLNLYKSMTSDSSEKLDGIYTQKINDVISQEEKHTNTTKIHRTFSMRNPNGISSLGVEVIDVKITQIKLPKEVSKAIYDRMRAEREAVARHHRAQGQEEAEKLRATADYEVSKTLAEAKRKGLILRGEGEAEAAKLFADAFKQDPDFYVFIRTLRAYKNSFHNKKNVIVLSPDSDFFRYMKISEHGTH